MSPDLSPARAPGVPEGGRTHYCMTPACGSIFDMRQGVLDEVRYCNRGHGQRWNGNKWDVVPIEPGTD